MFSSTKEKRKLQQPNTESVDLTNHKYNKNNVRVGDSVVVDIGYRYAAIVEGLKFDEKNRKIFAYLKNFAKSCPVKVDVCDCRKRENNI